MTLTRKMLKAMGIEEEKIDQIIEAHTETVDVLKADRDKNKEAAIKLAEVQKELDDLKATTGTDGNKYEELYNKTKKDFDDYKKEIENKEINHQKETAFRELLKTAGISEKRLDAIIKVTDLNTIKLKDGKIENYEERSKSVKSEWADFVVSTGTDAAKAVTPPAGGGKSFKSKDEIMAIKNDAERQRAIAENHELFGF